MDLVKSLKEIKYEKFPSLRSICQINKNFSKKGPNETNIIFALLQLKYCVGHLLVLKLFYREKEKVNIWLQNNTYCPENITGCLPRNAAQGFFVQVSGLDLVYFHNATAKF